MKHKYKMVYCDYCEYPHFYNTVTGDVEEGGVSAKQCDRCGRTFKRKPNGNLVWRWHWSNRIKVEEDDDGS